MSTSQATVSREVRRYLKASGITQRALGARIGLESESISRKLTGVRRWSLDDIDRLRDAGVPVCVSAGSWEAWR